MIVKATAAFFTTNYSLEDFDFELEKSCKSYMYEKMWEPCFKASLCAEVFSNFMDLLAFYNEKLTDLPKKSVVKFQSQ